MTSNQKENVQYITAIFTLLTGIVLCFLSFFLNEYEVHDSALWYFGETIAFAGSIFSVGIYTNHQIKKAELRLNTKIDDKMKKFDNLFKEES